LEIGDLPLEPFPNFLLGFISGVASDVFRGFLPEKAGIQIPPANCDHIKTFGKPFFRFQIVKGGKQFPFCQVSRGAKNNERCLQVFFTSRFFLSYYDTNRIFYQDNCFFEYFELANLYRRTLIAERKAIGEISICRLRILYRKPNNLVNLISGKVKYMNVSSAKKLNRIVVFPEEKRFFINIYEE